MSEQTFCVEHGIKFIGCRDCHLKTLAMRYREGRTVGRWQGGIVSALSALAVALILWGM